jgi:D-alanyl-lipoteichoic acid acyltransferase DltB (MBOAT superfamily)
MLFNSIAFLVFFPVVTTLYFLLNHKYRWFLLLVASCIFYMYLIPVYIFVLFLTILIDYFAGMLIEKTQEKKKKKLYLIVSIISTCTVLFVFKYFNFFNANLRFLSEVIGWNYSVSALHLILPVGLSFHTFQSLSYVIEVYYGRQKAEHNFGIYALYVMFYPQLVAGPIERPGNLLHQFYEEHYFEYIRVTEGLKQMIWGLFKKVVIADRLAILVNNVYEAPQKYDGIQLIAATIFFAFQIYCDFSGYSDIALGAAKVMGFKLMKNFNLPYYSRSISEFWKRWHISLSTWFKDYVYIPLGGNRVSTTRLYFNLFITFLISGFWHGANWTFIIWGSLNGMYLIAELITASKRHSLSNALGLEKIPHIKSMIKVLFTFCLICFAWIFFRANSVSDALYIITHIFSGVFQNGNIRSIVYKLGGLGLMKSEMIIAVLSIILLEAIQLIRTRIDVQAKLHSMPAFTRWALYCGIVYVILIFGAYNNTSKFIYFQF